MTDVIIIGAGAAGLMAAISAGRRGRRVLVIDHRNDIGAKILISGGGRCNFTNTGTAPDRFISQNKHFCRSALSRYRPADFIALVEKHGIAYHEKTLGQLFCDGSAKAIVAMLRAECDAVGVQFRLGVTVSQIVKSECFRLETSVGILTGESVIIATGGLSIPKMGATGFAHDVAKHFGVRVTETKPALVPLTFTGDLLASMQELSGVSLDTEISVPGRRFREASLFTHRGLSGPVILQISSYWEKGPITLNMSPGDDAAGFLLAGKQTKPRVELHNLLADRLPQRLAKVMAERSNAPSGARMADLPNKTLQLLAAQLGAWQITPAGTEGYAKAEVTKGGVDTRDLSSQTMQANNVPGLFFIGEAVDVTGWLGGYNFQWAWASGWAAGLNC